MVCGGRDVLESAEGSLRRQGRSHGYIQLLKDEMAVLEDPAQCVCRSPRHTLDRYSSRTSDFQAGSYTMSSTVLLTATVEASACYYPSALRESSTSSLYLSLFDVSLP